MTRSGRRLAARPGELVPSRRAGAASYGIIVNSSGGVQEQFQVSGRKHSLQVKNFPLTDGAEVTVATRNGLGYWSRTRGARLRAAAAPTSIFRTPLRHKPAKKKH